MYAIIRTGGKQAKVREGDVIDVEHLRAEGEVGFTPLLLVDDAGTVFSQREVLKGAKVVARVMGDSPGPKVEIFKYKSKTGYRRHQGHRQRYTTLEVIRIEAPEGAKRNPPEPKPAETAASASDAGEVTERTVDVPKSVKPVAAKAATKAPRVRASAAKAPADRKKKES
jgi:large subunit ribosomal protein L21